MSWVFYMLSFFEVTPPYGFWSHSLHHITPDFHYNATAVSKHKRVRGNCVSSRTIHCCALRDGCYESAHHWVGLEPPGFAACSKWHCSKTILQLFHCLAGKYCFLCVMFVCVVCPQLLVSVMCLGNVLYLFSVPLFQIALICYLHVLPEFVFLKITDIFCSVFPFWAWTCHSIEFLGLPVSEGPALKQPSSLLI